jgi:hypothetical protein
MLRSYVNVLERAVSDVMRDFFQDPIVIGQFREIEVELLLETYTTQEMQGLIDFYRTPLGKKTIAVMPEVARKSMERGMEVGKSLAASPKFNQMMSDKILQLMREGKIPN